MTNVRISAISFQSSPVNGFDDFADHVTRLIDETMDDRPDFVVFPELFGNELMTFFKERDLVAKFQKMAAYYPPYLDLLKEKAMSHQTHIIGGSQIKEIGGKLYNVAHLFCPDGRILEQQKLHLVPPEVSVKIAPGDTVEVFKTELAKIAILTCYDMEFPETARLAALQDAEILFSPSATLDQPGYWRVRYCAQARCIENQVYAVHCSLLGNWGDPQISFEGTSSILCPSEAGFPSKAVIAEGPFNREAVVSAELDLAKLAEVRKKGSAPTLKDRRPDLLEKLYRLEHS